MAISVYTLVGESALRRADGLRLRLEIEPSLRDGRRVEVDFFGVKEFSSAFLNSAIGDLLLPHGDLKGRLTLINVSSNGLDLLDRVLSEARRISADGYGDIVNAVVDEI
jgi:hypothetical protein